MASIKIKFRPTTVEGKEGGLYFQIINPPDEYGLQNKFLTYGLNFVKYPSGKSHNREYVTKRYEFLRFYVYFCYVCQNGFDFYCKVK